MNKIEIVIFAFLLGMAAMNNLHKNRDRIYKWIEKRTNKLN